MLKGLQVLALIVGWQFYQGYGVTLAVVTALATVSACEQDPVIVERTTSADPEKREYNELRAKLSDMDNTLRLLNEFAQSDFQSCSVDLPPFEAKVCKIAEVASATQSVEYFSALADMAAMFQTQIYGADCTSLIEATCPKNGSITSDLADIRQAIATQASSVGEALTALQARILGIESSITTVEARLDQFEEGLITLTELTTGLELDVASLAARLSRLETAYDPSLFWQTVRLCHDTSNSGPLYEALLFAGDKRALVGYVRQGNRAGLSVVATAGVSGNLYKSTTLNTRSCSYRIYDLGTALTICWNNQSREATALQIDQACGYPTFGDQTVQCTCY